MGWGAKGPAAEVVASPPPTTTTPHPQINKIREALGFAGALARAYDQRLTFHPSHFVKLASPDPELVAKSVAELEGHSTILDWMGYATPSCLNKINIHIGGTYGSKAETLARWADRYTNRLSPACRARVTGACRCVAPPRSVSLPPP